MLLSLVSTLHAFFRWCTAFGALLGLVTLLSGSGRRFLTACFALVSVDAWYSTALDIEKVLSGVADSDVHLFVADVVKSFDTVDRAYLTESPAFLGCLVGLGMRTFGNMLVLEFGLSFRPAFGKPGSERRASHRDVLSA